MNIDLNCDMGENIGNDEEIMPYITSANIACGFHAGDEMSILNTIRLAKKYGVAVGAHPGWKDLAGFGRHEMSFSSENVEALVLYQIGALHAIAKSERVELHHVKPHGALYNQAAKDQALADSITRAIKKYSSDLILVGLAGSSLVEAGLEAGLTVANEGFPDRNYEPNGTLTPRTRENAIIRSPEEISAHAVELAKHGVQLSGRSVPVDTLCLHGDHPYVVHNVKQVRQSLEKQGIRIAAL